VQTFEQDDLENKEPPFATPTIAMPPPATLVTPMPSPTIPINARPNRVSIVLPGGKWTDQQLEEVMDVMNKRHTSFMKVNKHWNISLTSLSNHLNGKIRAKTRGSPGLLTSQENETIILNMQKCELFITLQQFKLKVE
jgi:hypothetical protein